MEHITTEGNQHLNGDLDQPITNVENVSENAQHLNRKVRREKRVKKEKRKEEKERKKASKKKEEEEREQERKKKEEREQERKKKKEKIQHTQAPPNLFIVNSESNLWSSLCPRVRSSSERTGTLEAARQYKEPMHTPASHSTVQEPRSPRQTSPRIVKTTPKQDHGRGVAEQSTEATSHRYENTRFLPKPRTTGFRTYVDTSDDIMPAIADKLEPVIQRIWQEVFGVVRILLCVVISFGEELFNFLTLHVIGPLLVSIVQTLGVELICPILIALYDSFITPLRTLCVIVVELFTVVLEPVCGLIIAVLDILATLCGSIRLISIEYTYTEDHVTNQQRQESTPNKTRRSTPSPARKRTPPSPTRSPRVSKVYTV